MNIRTSRSPDLAEDIANGRVAWSPKCSVCGSAEVTHIEMSPAPGRHVGDFSCTEHKTDTAVVHE